MAVSKKTEEKVKTVVVSTETNIKSLLKEATGTVVVLNKLEVEKKLKALVKAKKERLTELVNIETLDKNQLDELKGIEREFRENRYALQNVGKHNVTALNLAKKNNGAMLDELELIISPSETIAKDKRVSEEKRLQDIKDEEDRFAQQKAELIQNKIIEAGKFFEIELETIRKTNDWTNFDEYYKKFEDELEELLEFEFEGVELLEKYEARKKEIVDLAKQAKEQEEKDGELKSKEAELKAEKEKVETEKARMLEMFTIGFMFNGVEFFKNETKLLQTEINEKTNEDFEAFVKVYKDEAKELADYDKLAGEAKELGLEWEIKEGEVRVDVLTALINKEKEAKTAEQAQKEAEEKTAKAKALKECGLVICDAIEISFKELEINIDPCEIINEEARKQVNLFLVKIKKEFSDLKNNLNQTEEVEEEK